MKKKLLCAMLASVLVLGIAGCGSTETTSSRKDKDDDDDDDVKSHVSSVVEETAESTSSVTVSLVEESSSAETTTVLPPEPVKENPQITSYSWFGNGSFAFSADGKKYVIDYAKRKCYDYTGSSLSGIQFVTGKVAHFGSTLYNLEKGEVIASESENGIIPMYLSLDDKSSEFIPVTKTEKSLEGNVTSFGILNSDGEWVLPLDSKYKICSVDYLDSISIGVINEEFLAFYSNELNIYDYKTDKMIKTSDCGSFEMWAFSNGGVVTYDWDSGYRTNLKKYDVKTGKTTIIEKDEKYKSDYIRFFRNGIDGFVMQSASGKYLILDGSLNKLVYDLSKFNVTYIYYATADFIVFNASNPDGDDFVVVMNRDGSYVVDPILGSANDAYIFRNYIVLFNTLDGDMIINGSSGETTTFDSDSHIDILDIDSDTGMALVSSDNRCYFLDLASPDHLIDPFDLV